MREFLATVPGQMLLSFSRVFAATFLACWLEKGMTLRDLTGGIVVEWVELGLVAGVTLVLANYFGPWESRYGRRRRKTGGVA
jgi:hypothetical protein